MAQIRSPAFFPTKFGITTLFVSIGLLMHGVLRRELFSLISAGALVVALVLSFAASVAFFLLISAKRFIPTDSSMNRVSFFLQAYRKTAYSADAYVPFKKSITAFVCEIPWNQPFSPQDIKLSRGAYLPHSDAYAFYDIFSFFRISVPLPEQLSPSGFIIPPRKASAGGRADGNSKFALPTGTSLFNRSNELVENRLYHPGDDPRKINWKQYAHSGSLILREGELLPPPDTRITVFFQGLGEKRVSKTDAARHDMLINRVCSLCEDLLLRGFPLRIILRDAQALNAFSRTDIELHQPNPSAVIERLLSSPRLQDPPLSQEDFQKLCSPHAAILLVSPEKSEDVFSLSFPSSARVIFVSGPMSAKEMTSFSIGTALARTFLQSDNRRALFKNNNKQLERFAAAAKDKGYRALLL